MRDLERLSAFLASEGRPRVWSILVTILGDIGEASGGPVKMQTCLSICRRIGIEEQAVRTAMSRLVKEGLVVGERLGRTSSYQFSAAARADYAAAAPLVYAAPVVVTEWACAVLPPQPERAALLDRLAGTHPFLLGDALAVWPGGSLFHGKAVDVAGGDVVWLTDGLDRVPGWAADSHAPRMNTAMAALIVETLGRSGWSPPTDPDEAQAVRILAVHFWRRLVLRHPAVHAPLPDDVWPMSRAQAALAGTYRSLGGTPGRFE